MTIKRVEALELSEVLGSLLGSVVEAQSQAARASIAFIEDVGFETTADGDVMRSVQLRYTKKDENGEPASFEVEVPLLTLVNVPSLAVKEAKLSFSYDVVTSASTSTTPRPAGSSRLASLGNLKAARLTGFVKRRPAPSQPEKRSTSIDLDVTLEQQEIPLGIERLFDLAELGITERPAPEED